MRAIVIGLALLAGLMSPARAADNLLAQWPNSLDLEIQQSVRPAFTGHLALPDGTGLLLTLTRTASLSLADQSHYVAQAESVLHDGRFGTDGFADAGLPLKPGVYLIEIDAVLPDGFAGIPASAGDPDKALAENTKHAVLTGHRYDGPVNRHAYWRVELIVPNGVPLWFAPPRA